MRIRIFLFLFVFLLSACAGPSQTDISIKPYIDVPLTQLGHNKKVGVVVEDLRPNDSVIGRTSFGKNIRLSADMLDNIQTQINHGLKNSGFKPVAGHENKSATIVVRILGIQYRQLQASPKALLLPVVATSIFEVVASANGKTYEKIYRTDDEYHNYIQSVNSDINQINTTIANSLMKLLTDRQLIEFLAS